MLPVGSNPLITMASSDLLNFGKKFLNSAYTHQVNEIEKDVAMSKQSAQIANDVRSGVKDIFPAISDVIGAGSDSDTAQDDSYDSGNSSSSTSKLPVQPQTLEYLNAELAKHYGMGKSTAYQEALSNTAYQRAVKDMQSAGLNPAAIFGSGKGYTAGGVSYVDDGSGSESGSGSGSNKKLMSAGLYYGISTAVGLATAALTGNPANYWIGSYATQGALGALNAAVK